MKLLGISIVGLFAIATAVQAADALDAEAVKKLLSGNTVHAETPDGGQQRNYFAPDGTTIRKMGDRTVQGTWQVNEDGTQCVMGMPGGCARIVRNDDGTYDRIVGGGKTRLRWTKVVPGKDL